MPESGISVARARAVQYNFRRGAIKERIDGRRSLRENPKIY